MPVGHACALCKRWEGLLSEMKILLQIVAFIAASFATTLGQEWSVWYVKPTPDSPCPPDERCHTFSEIFHNVTIAESVFSSNTILAVLSGDHILNFEAESFLIVKNLQNFTILGSSEKVVGSDTTIRPASRFVCTSRFAMAFINASRLSFTNLTFSNCGANITTELAHETFPGHTIHTFGPEQKAALFFLNVQTFRMVSCVVERSFGYGLLGVNVLGESAILGSTFYSNNDYTATLDRCTFAPSHPQDITACSGGNALFVFEDLNKCPLNIMQYTLQILNSAFIQGVNGFGGRLPDKYLTRGAGLGIVLSQSSYGMTITMNKIILYRNSALIGANLYIAMYETMDNSTVSLKNSRSASANDGSSESGRSSGGLHVDYNMPSTTPPVCRSKSKYQEEIMTITNCLVDQNVALTGGGAFINIRTSSDKHARFTIKGCTFRDNVGTSGTAIYVSQQESFFHQGTASQVIFEDVNIITNRYTTSIRNLTELYTNFQLNAVQLIQAKNVSFSNCTFAGNDGTALSAFSSEIFMSNSTVFVNNSGIIGGAINLENSHLIFAPHTQLTFRDNYARTHGGAINVIGRSDGIFPCFYQVIDPNCTLEPDVNLYFEGNYAKEAGSVLYGGSVDRCIVQSSYTLSSTDLFDLLVDIGPHSNDTSLISSDPNKVCVCVNNVPNCARRNTKISLPAGATVDFPFVTVGQRGGVTPSRVYVVTDPDTELGQFQQAQQIGKTCTKLNFTIKTIASDTKFVVRTSNLDASGSFMVNVRVEPCPLGFILNQNGECICDPISQLPDYTSTCSIDNRTVHRQGGSWVSPYFSEPNGSYEGVIVFLNCPYDYCCRADTELDLTDPDSQCEFNRSGVLCGACKPGLSLTIGTNKCIECSNANAALVLGGVVFAVGLLAMLYILNLTVAILSGIIFYANIVYTNYTIFFPARSNSALLLIISWLNLDSATETCFYDGKNEYAKAWLAYAVSFAIWVVVLIIILASRFSNTIARLCGSRSVPVLATLLLLSFNKLLSVVIISLSFSVITYPDGSLRVVWTNDGNIDSWRGKHIALGMFSVAVILLFIVPYTLLLALVPLSCIQAYSSHRLLSWVNKLKPFMDAYQGRYKNDLRNWTGILLLVRIFLSILNAVKTRDYNNDVILLVIAIVMFLLMGFGWVARGGMYKHWPLNILECSFFLNLGILSVATLFVRRAEGGGQNAVIHTSGIIALLELAGILVYQMYTQIYKLKRVRRWKETMIAKVKRQTLPKEGSINLEELTPSLAANTDTTSTVVSFADLRESIIDDN